MIRVIGCVVLSSMLNALGQVCFKAASNRAQLAVAGHRGHFIRNVMSRRRVWLGWGLMAAGLMVWLVAMSQTDLSVIYPIGSLYYVFILLFSHFFLKEKIDAPKIFGTIMILLGILTIVQSSIAIRT